MKVMLIAGEASGDLNAAELTMALAKLAPGSSFFGAGGPKMAAAGVELAVDLTKQSSIGLDFILKLPAIRRVFLDLVSMAVERKPDVILLIDFSGFNHRLAAAIRKRIRTSPELQSWRPKIAQYVSPQVWASRPGRAKTMARDIDLLLCLFPFEKEWYAQRVPQLPVECVGHPILDRHEKRDRENPNVSSQQDRPLVALLPGSRSAELRRHLPVMLEAARLVAQTIPARFEMILPNETLAAKARKCGASEISGMQMKIGGLADTLSRATIAITKTGTITLECAYFGVPSVAIYKTSWLTYEVGRRIVTVRYLSMPNLLADRAVFPELVQGDATAENVAREALSLLGDANRRRDVAATLDEIMRSLGGPGAAQRAAQAILKLASDTTD
jgi:lipid-A-disaccharide synthase